MPRAQPVAGPDLSIEQRGDIPCHPGGVVRGLVVRRTAPTVSPMCTVEVGLTRRVKVKIVESSGQGSVEYRSRLFLVNIRQKLYAGPMHIQPGGRAQAWEFAISIPWNADPRLVLSDKASQVHKWNRPDCHYFQSLDPGVIGSLPLPPSFVATGLTFEAFVEYALHASLFLQGTDRRTCTALRPIQIRPLVPNLLTTISLARYYEEHTFTSFRLNPAMEYGVGHLNFTDHFSQFLKTPRVPRLSLYVQADVPTVIQLGCPWRLPFRVRIVASRRNTSEILHHVRYTAWIKKFELLLIARTEVKAPGSHGSTSDTVTHAVFPTRSLIRNPGFAMLGIESRSRGSDSKDKEDDDATGFPDSVPKDSSGRREKDGERADRGLKYSQPSTEVKDQSDLSAAVEKKVLPDYDKEKVCSEKQPIFSGDKERKDMSDGEEDRCKMPVEYQSMSSEGIGNGFSSSSPEKETMAPSSSTELFTWSAAGQPNRQLPFFRVKWDNEESEMVDLGSLLELWVESCTMHKGAKRIDPDFTTWSIRHTHQWRWRMSIQVSGSGQSSTFGGTQDVTVVGPCEMLSEQRQVRKVVDSRDSL